MAKARIASRASHSLTLLKEIQAQLGEIDVKIEHLIKTCSKFYFTTDFSDSVKSGFKD